jgi:thiol-disulfide isomerase/thioredoxin
MYRMDTFADVARALLTVVFTVAAVAKLLDLPRSRRTMAAFGVKPRWAGPAGTALPFAELTTAVLLVLEPTAQLGAILALALLIVFMAGVSNALAKGRTPDCNCFGQIQAEPLSWRTMVRNGMLAALAVVPAAHGPGDGLLAFTGEQTAQTLAALLALSVVAAAVIVSQMRQQAKSLEVDLAGMRRRTSALPSGLPVGLRAPGFSLPEVHTGEKVTLDALCSRGRPVLLLFVSPDCGPCIRLFPEIERWNAVLSDRVTFAVVSNGGSEREQIAAQLREVGSFTTLVQEQAHEVADLYFVMATPSAIVIDRNGRVASGQASGPDEIEALVRVALDQASEESDPHGGRLVAA